MSVRKSFWICIKCGLRFKRLTWYQRVCPVCQEKKKLEVAHRWAGYKTQYERITFEINRRDGNKCKICGAIETDKNYKKKLLEVHHWDKNHENNSWDNLITLCHKCHSRLHRYVYPEYKNH